MADHPARSRMAAVAPAVLVLLGYGWFIATTYRPYLDSHLRLRSPRLAGLPEDVIGYGFWMWWPVVTVLFALSLVAALWAIRRRLHVAAFLLTVFALLSSADYLLCERLVQELIHPSAVEAELPQTSSAATLNPRAAARVQPAAASATTGREPVDTTTAVVAGRPTADAQSDSSRAHTTAARPANSVATGPTPSAAASTPAASAASPVETPSEWGITGPNVEGYTLQTNRLIPLSGNACATLISIPDVDTSRFGALFQTASAREFAGKRLEFSGYIATKDAPAGASIWLRADASDRTIVGFENTMARGIRGTEDWTYQVIVMDVPPEAAALLYGAYLNGRGTLYVDDLQFRIVDASTPVTAKPIPSRGRLSAGVDLRISAPPRNLDFEQTRPAGSDH